MAIFTEQLKAAISAEIKSFLDTHSVKYNNAGSFEDLILNYFNFKGRSISAKPSRQINYSKEVQEKISNNANLKDLMDFFVEKIHNGDDLTGWQSKTLFDAEKPDWLFNHWEIKHLHMSKDKGRSNNILLLVETSLDVYFVDIVNHPKGSGWTAFDFLKTLHNNHWLSLIGFSPCLDIIPGSLEPKVEKDEDIYLLYKSNMNIAFEIEDVAYISLNGVVSSGNKFKHSYWLTRFNKYTSEYSKLNVEFISFELGDESCFGKIVYRFGNEKKSCEIPNP